MKKKILSLLMTLSLTLIPCVSAYAEAESVPAAVTEEMPSDDLMFTDTAKAGKAAAASGNCGAQGSNVKWSFSNGVLTISGKGKMADDSPVPFYNMNVQKIIIKNGVTSIGSQAFVGCSSLTSVTIPSSVVSIGEAAFAHSGLLKTITIPSSVKSIGTGAFRGCGLTSVTIPASVTSIEDGVFSLCTNLAKVTIPSSVKTIGDEAFALCSSLKSVTIPASVTSIGRLAFNYCEGLKNITIKNSTCKIPESPAFNPGVTLGVPGVTTVHGYKGSTAEAFAKKWKYSFKSLGASPLAAPKISKVQITSQGIKISWGKVSGAKKYRVFYKTGKKGWMKLADTKAISYTWKKAAKGKKYTFTVRCISADGKKYTSFFDTAGKSIVYSAAAQ